MTLDMHRPPAPKGTRRAKRRDVSPVVPALVAVVGLLLLLYPVFATQHNDIQHQKRANEYSVSVHNADPEALEKSLAEAEQYNRDLTGGVIFDPFLEDVVPDTEGYQYYLKHLTVLDAMAQLRVPAANVNLPVYHGTQDDVLKKGVGHLYGSSLPVGGKGTRSILTAHTGLGDATLFNDLHKVKEGDAIYLNTAGRKMKYVVTTIEVVEPTDVETLKRDPNKDLVTLITCTPYGVNSHRLLVTGERAPLDAADEALLNKEPDIKAEWKWWMIALLVGAAIAALVVGGLLFRLAILKKRQAKEDPHDEAEGVQMVRVSDLEDEPLARADFDADSDDAEDDDWGDFGMETGKHRANKPKRRFWPFGDRRGDQ